MAGVPPLFVRGGPDMQGREKTITALGGGKGKQRREVIKYDDAY